MTRGCDRRASERSDCGGRGVEHRLGDVERVGLRELQHPPSAPRPARWRPNHEPAGSPLEPAPRPPRPRPRSCKKCMPTNGSGTHDANLVPRHRGHRPRSSPWSEQASPTTTLSSCASPVGLGVRGALPPSTDPARTPGRRTVHAAAGPEEPGIPCSLRYDGELTRRARPRRRLVRRPRPPARAPVVRLVMSKPRSRSAPIPRRDRQHRPPGRRTRGGCGGRCGHPEQRDAQAPSLASSSSTIDGSSFVNMGVGLMNRGTDLD